MNIKIKNIYIYNLHYILYDMQELGCQLKESEDMSQQETYTPLLLLLLLHIAFQHILKTEPYSQDQRAQTISSIKLRLYTNSVEIYMRMCSGVR